MISSGGVQSFSVNDQELLVLSFCCDTENQKNVKTKAN